MKQNITIELTPAESETIAVALHIATETITQAAKGGRLVEAGAVIGAAKFAIGATQVRDKMVASIKALLSERGAEVPA